MISNYINERGLVILGCGKMGSALLSGWLKTGLKPSSVWILDPKPSEWSMSVGAHLNVNFPEDPAIVLIAVKPQVMGAALPQLKSLRSGKTLFISVAAGTTLSSLENALGAHAAIVRTMPNTPASVGHGITALIGNGRSSKKDMGEAERLMSAVGQTIVLENEDQMDAVTGVSGSGPAYLFYMIEALALAGQKQGLSSEVAMKLSIATLAGAGALASQSSETAEQLRINVTSPNGTTQAALQVLMNERAGLKSLMAQTVTAATMRSKELSNG